MPTRHFLSSSRPLGLQVAQWTSSRVCGGSLLITPTSGAARQICRHFEADSKDLPKFAQPMQALLPERDNVATPIERSLAWAKAIQQATPSEVKEIFWEKRPVSTSDLIKYGRKFITLCDQLAEAGLDPRKLKITHFTQDCYDANRWTAIARLYDCYVDSLKQWKLCDPNTLRLGQISKPDKQIKGVIIASVPDLPRAFELYACELENKGTQVDILIWNPANKDEEHFDSWGRPLPKVWKDTPIDIDEGQIVVSKSARDEARVVAKFTLEAPTSLVVADSKICGLIASEIAAKGQKPYQPEGESLTNCEASKIALNWDDFRRSKDLRRLRHLLELPTFCKLLDGENPISQTDALIAIDHLLGKSIADTLDVAWQASQKSTKQPSLNEERTRSMVRRLLGRIQNLLQKSTLELVELAFANYNGPSSHSSKRVISIGRQLEGSNALKNWKQSGSIPAQLWAEAIYSERSQEPPKDGSISLNGWLEAPWLCQKRIMLCGLVDGRIPQSVDGDTFLPDSIRSKLGLGDNSQRHARDAYLFSALIAFYPKDQLRLSYSKYDSSGDPNKPSRLLLSTSLDELPSRVKYLSRPNDTVGTSLCRQTNWRWKLPTELSVPTKISPTHFESYLRCPFRFCLEKVLLCGSAPKASHEMDAAAFGNLIHHALEKFGREIIPMGKAMLELDERSINKRVQDLLVKIAQIQFGKNPAPAVQIQIASAEIRLKSFARVQAMCFSEGWVILDVERKLEATDENPLHIGPLRLSGTIDRIEQNINSKELRVIDYKTFSSVKKPVETHLAPQSQNWFSLAKVEKSKSQKIENKTWKNLQLPLYRKIVEHWYPSECSMQKPELTYLILPSDPNESGIYGFDELSEELYSSAIACAEAVAKNITKKVFWPPRPFLSNWDDPAKPLFINGRPEDCIEEESIERLKGTKN